MAESACDGHTSTGAIWDPFSLLRWSALKYRNLMQPPGCYWGFSERPRLAGRFAPLFPLSPTIQPARDDDERGGKRDISVDTFHPPPREGGF